MAHSYAQVGPCPAVERVESHRGLEMADPDIGLSSPQPEPATPLPTHCKIRVEFKGTVDQCDGGGEVFAAVAEHPGNEAQNLGIAPSNSKRATGKVDCLALLCAGVVCPAG